MHNQESGDSDKSPEQQALEQRVDVMMSTKPVAVLPPKPVNPKPVAPPAEKTEAPPPKQLQTAPKLPDASAKKAEVVVDEPKPYKLKTPDKPPIVIALADTEADKAVEQPAPATETPVPATGNIPDDPLQDGATDKAVDEIVAKEGDTLLALDDAKAARRQAPQPSGWKDKLAGLFKNKKTWAVLLVLLIVLLAVPTTRYKLTGLVIKKSVTIVVIDSQTASPVSGADVHLDGKTVKTDAYGKARLKASLGQHSLVASKHYYKSTATSYFVGFKAAPSPTSVKLIATGRLVPVLVINKVSGKPLGGAEIHVLDTTAKTNSKGEAIIALPTTSTSDEAEISHLGYNQTKFNIQITDKFIKANSFELTPAGHIYFLSNQSGKIDVVKSDLDGANRKTVLAGTGHEDASTTSLLASRDWRYLVLKAHRDGAYPALYLVDTSTDKVAQFDNSDSDFNLIGWYGHAFMYDMTRKSVSSWQSGKEIIKSYDADNLQLNQLDQNQAEGDAANYAYQEFYNFYIVNGALVYNTQWYSHGTTDLGAKTDTIRAVQPSGQNKKDYQTLASSTNDYIQAKLYNPQAIYYSTHNNSDNKTTYYEYANQSVKTASIDDNTFAADYPTYLISPSATKTFWTELRDGKNTLFVGDDEAKSKKQVASLSDYTPYGWYSDGYTLVSKGSSELFVMPAEGLASGRSPLKITDYYKPAQTYAGYGYGYGGL